MPISFPPVDFPAYPYYFLVVVTLLAAIYDIAVSRITNYFSLPLAIFGIAYYSLQSGGDGLMFSLAGFFVGFAVFLPGYLSGMTGGGDLKLMAAVGTILGYKLVLLAFLLYLMAGLSSALAYGVYAWLKQGADPPFARYWAMLRTLFRTGSVSYVPPKPREVMGRRLPMAPAIAFGAITAPLLTLS